MHLKSPSPSSYTNKPPVPHPLRQEGSPCPKRKHHKLASSAPSCIPTPPAAMPPEYAAAATDLMGPLQSPTAKTPGSLVSKNGACVSMSPASVLLSASCSAKGPFGAVKGALT